MSEAPNLPLDEAALDSLRPMLSSLGDMSGVQTKLVDDVFAQARAALALRDHVAELKARELRAENELAAVLPEDVGPVEYIGALRDRCERQERLLAELRPVVRNVLHGNMYWIRANNLHRECAAMSPATREWALADEPQGNEGEGA